jgi:hypothetical protein
MSTSTEYITIADSTGISYVNSMIGGNSYPYGQSGSITMEGLQQTFVVPSYQQYPSVVVNYSSIMPLAETVQYTIYKLVYKLSRSSPEKELVFAYKSNEAPELGIMKAADKANLEFIEILSLQELETSEVFLLQTQKVKEIEL